MNETPLVSIIIPHKWDRELLCIRAIKEQSYHNLEIIIQVDNDLINSAIPRNRGAEKAKGKYLFFCDDDIILKPGCIEKMVNILEENPNVSFVYCDYRRSGTLSGVQKGEEWDYIELCKRNYISTMSMVRADAFKLAQFNENLKRYIDWDYWLTLGEFGLDGKYIPEILFTAIFGKEGISLGGPMDRRIATEKIKRKHNIKERKYSIIMCVHNEVTMTAKCIDSIVQNTVGDYELIIVDDGSNYASSVYLDTFSNIATILRTDKQLHHTRATNLGIAEANGKYLILLNNDTLVSKGWNDTLRRHFKACPNPSCIGPLTSAGASCQELSKYSSNKQHIQLKDVAQIQKEIIEDDRGICFPAKITGFCMFTSSVLMKEVIGLFDPEILAGGNEAEWIIRAFKLMKLEPFIDTSVYVHHFGKASYGRIDYKPIE